MTTDFEHPRPLIIDNEVFADQRGHFFEAFNRHDFSAKTGFSSSFLQDNQSRSARGVLRGLHYQIEPRAQGKLVRVVKGAVFDVAVDIRRSSRSFRRWYGVELSEDNLKQLWVPPGYAHGFLALTNPADVVYKVSEYYSPEHERTISWDDPEIGIEWPLDGAPLLSDKDASAPYSRDAEVFD
jgi:dTDP-4-dehydrorhamnose 3,5-epimerase